MSELYGQDHGGPESGKRQGSSGYCLKSIHKTIVRDMPPEQKILYALMQEAISCTSLTTTIKEERL